MQTRPVTRTTHERAGFLTPAIAAALVVVMACLALVLDRLWLDAASVELRTAAEASALAAARELASDDLLRQNADWSQRLEDARSAAINVAQQNRAAGTPVVLADGDVRFGRLVAQADTGDVKFLETDNAPTSVFVTAQRTRARLNPIVLFIRGLTGRDNADVVRRGEATIDNHVAGVRPTGAGLVPVLPIAILHNDPAGERDDTWQKQIEQQAGADQYAVDNSTQSILDGSDGLREIRLHSKTSDGKASEANLCALDLGNGFEIARLATQIKQGLSAADLEMFGGEIGSNAISTDIEAAANIDGSLATALQQIAGQPRIVLLYSQFTSVGNGNLGTARLSGIAAARVLFVEAGEKGSWQVVLQPTVIATRTAVLAEGTVATNPYIYKLHVTQ